MGSPLSPLLCNIYMEKLEANIMSTLTPRPVLWKRYVDDTFCIWEKEKSELEKFLTEINEYHSNIKFTMEMEENGRLAFLDILCMKKGSKIETTVYRKPTTTFQLVHAHSAHHVAQKEGVIQCLTHRAMNICSKNYLQEELRLLKDIFMANGYKPQVVEQKMNRVLRKRRGQTNADPPSDNKEIQKLLVLPYDKNLCRNLNAIKRIYNLKIVTKPSNTIKQYLVHPKDRVPREKRCNVVYEVPLTDGKKYIGETSRPLAVRLKEHAEAVKRLEVNKNAIAEYVATSNAKPLWEKSRILAREENWYQRRVKEAMWIERRQENINRNHGLEEITKAWQ